MYSQLLSLGGQHLPPNLTPLLLPPEGAQLIIIWGVVGGGGGGVHTCIVSMLSVLAETVMKC